MKNTSKLVLLLIAVLCFVQRVYPQDLKIDVNRVYNRNSLSFMIVSHPGDEYDKWTLNSFKQNDIGGKYNLNPVSSSVYEASFARNGNDSILFKAALIEKYLNEKGFAKEIVEHWYNRKPDGSMDMMNVYSRGRYNATEKDYQVAMMTKRGENRLFDEGNELIDKSYIVVFDVRAINKTIFETTGKLVWNGMADVYLFKVVCDDDIKKQIYDCWFEAGDSLSADEKRNKRDAFDRINFSVKHELTTSSYIQPNVSGVMLNTFLDVFSEGNSSISKVGYFGNGETEYRNFIFDMYKQSLEALETQRPDFKVKTTIVSDWPVRAKVGLKEGLTKKQHFAVYEALYDDRTNEVYAKEVATIMSTRIGRNRFNAYGNNMSEKRAMTKFAVVAKSANIEPGMFIEAQPGLGNTAFYHDIIVGPDICMVSLFGMKNLNFMTTSSFSGSLLFDLWLANNKVYLDEDTPDAGEDNWSFGLRLGYSFGFNLFHPNIKLEPFTTIGYGMSTYNLDNSEESSDGGGSESKWNEAIFSVGSNLVFNINYPFQVYLKGESVFLASSGEMQSGFGIGVRYTIGANSAKNASRPGRVKMKSSGSFNSNTLSNIPYSNGSDSSASSLTQNGRGSYRDDIYLNADSQLEQREDSVFDKEVFALAGLAFHPSQKSMYAMVGKVEKKGSYLKVKSNFNFSGKHDEEDDSYDLKDDRYLDGDEKKGRFALTGGMLLRINPSLMFYGGLGYGTRWVNWTATNGDKLRVSDISYRGLELESGLIYKHERFFINGGISVTSFKYMEANIGFGMAIKGPKNK